MSNASKINVNHGKEEILNHFYPLLKIEILKSYPYFLQTVRYFFPEDYSLLKQFIL